MTVYTLYMYNRLGVCLFYRRWHQQSKGKRGIEHETKLMWGLLFSMKELVNKMTPRQLDETEPTPLQSFTTHDSRVHYFETMTGLRLVLVTDVAVSGSGKGGVMEVLAAVYRLWVELCVRNPLYVSSVGGEGAATAVRDVAWIECVRGRRDDGAVNGLDGTGEPKLLELDCPAFVDRVVQLIEQLPYFH